MMGRDVYRVDVCLEKALSSAELMMNSVLGRPTPSSISAAVTKSLSDGVKWMRGEQCRLHLPGSAQRRMNAFQSNKILLSILPALMDYLSRWGNVRRSVRRGHSQ